MAKTKYGDHISLIDAMYRTMKYKLFSVCVCKNVGYSVAAQFIVQSEVWNVFQRHVLKKLKSHLFSLCHFSDVESLALKQTFPSMTVHGCDFGHSGYKTGKVLWTGVMLTAYLSSFVFAPGHHLDQITLR